MKRFGSAVARVTRRRPGPAAGDRADIPAAALHRETADGVRLIHSPYEDPPEAAGVPWQLLRAGSGCVTVVVGAAAAADTALWPALGDVFDSLVEEGTEEVRLTLAGAAARQSGVHPSVAQRVADAWGLRVTAADGSVLVVPDGSLFTAAESPGAVWHRFGPGGRVETLGPRHPAPAWQAAYDRLPHHLDDGCVVDPVPAGVLVRGERDAPPGPGGLPYAVLPDAHRPLVLVGSVRGRPVPASVIATLLAALPGNVRDVTRLASSTHRDLLPIVQEVADLLGVRTEVLTGLPLAAEDDVSGGGAAITLTDTAGRPTWRPTVSVVGCLPTRPGERPRPPQRVRLRSPLTGGRLEPDGTVGLSDHWRLTLTRSGGVVEARTEPPSHPAVRLVDPERFAVEVRWQGARTDPSLLRACEVLLNDLHPQLRCCTELRVGRLVGDALRDATRLAVRHGVALTQVPALPGVRPGTVPPAGHRPPGTTPADGLRAVTATALDGPAQDNFPARAGRSRQALAALTGDDNGQNTTTARSRRDAAGIGTPQQPSRDNTEPPSTGARVACGPAASGSVETADPGAAAGQTRGEAAGFGALWRASGDSSVPSGPNPGDASGPAASCIGTVRAADPADLADGSGPRSASPGDRRDGPSSPAIPEAGLPVPEGRSRADTPPLADRQSGLLQGRFEDDDLARAPRPVQAPGSRSGGLWTGELGMRPPVAAEDRAAGVAAEPLRRAGVVGSAGPAGSPGEEVGSDELRTREREMHLAVPAAGGAAAVAAESARPAALAVSVGSTGPAGLSGPGPGPDPDAGRRAGGGHRVVPEGGVLSVDRADDLPAAAGEAKGRFAPPAVIRPPTAQDRAAFRELAGGVWDRHVFAVSRALVRMPAWRGARADETTCDLLAVHLYLTAPEDEPFAPQNLHEALCEQDSAMLPYAVCLAAGLRRLPSYRGVALRGPGTEVTHAPGSVLRTGDPVGALPWAAAANRTPGYAFWAVTARRTRPLLGPDAEDLVLFLPGTEFDVLGTVGGEGSAPPVLLGERVLGPAGDAAASPAAERSRRIASDRLQEALRELAAARPDTSPDWPLHCQGEVH